MTSNVSLKKTSNAIAVPARNKKFDAFVHTARAFAERAGIDWNIALDAAGVARTGEGWDLRKVAKDGRPRLLKLQVFSHSKAALHELSKAGIRQVRVESIAPVSDAWQDIIKAHAIEHILVRQKTPAYIQQSSNAWRFLATVADKEPWLVTADDVALACELSNRCQPSGGRSIVLASLISAFVDPLHLFNACPLKPLLSRSINQEKKRTGHEIAAKSSARKLADRKNEERLPEQRAFWELVRIVFTEVPLSFNDALRFAMVRILLFTGLRLGEVALLPLDCRRTRAYFDANGRDPKDVGGISDSLSLRHFAEKQGKNALHETTQFVPEIFREALEDTLDLVAKLTAPLRATLKSQYESGRILPMYEKEQLLDLAEAYVRVTGCAVWAKTPTPEIEEVIRRYKRHWDVKELEPLARLHSEITAISPAMSSFYSQDARRAGLKVRDSSGKPDDRPRLRVKLVLVEDVERFMLEHLPHRVSHLAPIATVSGQSLAPWELLFLFPKGAAGHRDKLPVDTRLVAGVGVADQAFLQSVLGGYARNESLFSIYGRTEEDKALSIKSHSLRHLQNTELFRLGVADTIISKRFNRRGVTQSYEYDHRSLAEELDELELPDAWSDIIGSDKAATVAKLIESGRAQGPIVREFKRIQTEEGDEAALRFLAAEADGFHATPYGFCLNSFTVDPCPKHLECFTGCRHLSATDLPENRQNVVVLHGRLKQALDKAEARPLGSVGRENQIAHGKARLEGVEKLLAARPGTQVFPDGADLSQSNSSRSVLHGT